MSAHEDQAGLLAGLKELDDALIRMNWFSRSITVDVAAQTIRRQVAEIDRLRAFVAYVGEWQVDIRGDVLHFTGADTYDHRTRSASGLLAMLRSAAKRAAS